MKGHASGGNFLQCRNLPLWFRPVVLVAGPGEGSGQRLLARHRFSVWVVGKNL